MEDFGGQSIIVVVVPSKFSGCVRRGRCRRRRLASSAMSHPSFGLFGGDVFAEPVALDPGFCFPLPPPFELLLLLFSSVSLVSGVSSVPVTAVDEVAVAAFGLPPNSVFLIFASFLRASGEEFESNRSNLLSHPLL